MNKKTRLLLVGEGVTLNKIKDDAERLNLSSSILFLGIRSDVNRLLQAMDAVIYPSVFEGLPVFLVEAQASGLPLFISDTITRSINITGNVVFLDIRDEPEKWSRIILDKISNFKRKDTTREIKQAGYCIADVAHELEKIYFNQL